MTTPSSSDPVAALAEDIRALRASMEALTRPTPPLLDAEEAAELLNVPKSWILAEARAERIPHVRLGRYVRYDSEQLRDWAAGRTVGPRRGLREAA